MSINEYLMIPPPPPSIQSSPISHTHQQQPQMSASASPSSSPIPLSLNDQIKLCSMKYKIIRHFSEMFQLNNVMGSPIKNMLIFQFLGILIEKYQSDPDHVFLVRLHGLLDTSIRTATITLCAIEECIYLCNNPRVIETIYIFTKPH
jgi:hypothetical protein